MRSEPLPGRTNVVRFPLEQRVTASLEAVFAVQPDWREVERAAAAFHMELPACDLHHRVDAETARYIAEQILPLAPCERQLALDVLLRPVVARAVAACWQADHARQQATAAHMRLLAAQMQGGSWLDLLEEQADAATRQAAELLIVAHQRCQEARGVARAVGFARRGEPWAPCDTRTATLTQLADARRNRLSETDYAP